MAAREKRQRAPKRPGVVQQPGFHSDESSRGVRGKCGAVDDVELEEREPDVRRVKMRG